MRISTAYKFEAYSSRIQEAASRYFEAQERVMSGKRFTRVSEDPVSAVVAMSARSLRTRLEQLTDNLANAREYAGTTEQVLDEVGRLTRKAYTLAIQGASDATTQESRDAMAREIATIQDAILEAANTKGLNGKHIFAGQKTDTKPFAASGGTLTFDGDTLPVTIEVRPGEMMRANLENADVFFIDLYDTLETLRLDLVGGDIGKISDQDIDALLRSIDTIGVARGSNGVRLNDITRIEAENTRRTDDLTKTISDSEDIDLAEAITQMQMAETAYTAALQTAGQGFRLSLMDFLR